ncbi:uncharacterized protein LOC129601574 isoform X2 [Paramacrobiotus metropolitanus]|uniref:uncharacterized protein LOC129601574 isoform X2 n=1 Tax=Paramacrobiotus metropolitanus TaxID=2943436 RepID=UPI0024461BE5|nr:uncharacterized protein LOC129601574 isoform X2 [Paramacrobiotus metropolitanus]
MVRLLLHPIAQPAVQLYSYCRGCCNLVPALRIFHIKSLAVTPRRNIIIHHQLLDVIMNNASFHLSTTSTVPLRHPMLMPNHSAESSIARLLSSTTENSVYHTAAMQSPANNNNNMGSVPSTPQHAMSFPGQRDLLLGPNAIHFPYLGATFNGLPMFPTGTFGMFPSYGSFFPKSPVLGSPVPNFLNAYLMNKDELLWQKRSPSNLPESPLSGTSRSSPGDIVSSHKRFCRSRYTDQNSCPVCGQSVVGATMQEHFLEELKAYRQTVHNMDPQTGTPAEHVKSRHANSLSATPTEIDSRLEIFSKVRNNRKARLPSTHEPSRTRPSEAGDLQRELRHGSRHKHFEPPPSDQAHGSSEEKEDELINVDVDNGDSGSPGRNSVDEPSYSRASLVVFKKHKRKLQDYEEYSPRNDEATSCPLRSPTETKTTACSECQLDLPITILYKARNCQKHWYCGKCRSEKNLMKDDRCIRCCQNEDS